MPEVEIIEELSWASSSRSCGDLRVGSHLRNLHSLLSRQREGFALTAELLTNIFEGLYLLLSFFLFIFKLVNKTTYFLI